MNRTQLINGILAKRHDPVYLEIGVRNGENFFSIRSNRKFGVDPEYFFSKKFLLKSLMNKKNWFYRMFRKTSDDFFSLDAHNVFKENKIDVAFIDGLHTYEQSLRDAVNCLLYLKEGGYIVIHDCNPLTLEAASSQIPQKPINWNGDVWKTIYHFRKYENCFDCYTLDFDEGLGILRIKSSNYYHLINNLIPDPEIMNLTFDDLNCNRDEFIGLKKL